MIWVDQDFISPTYSHDLEHPTHLSFSNMALPHSTGIPTSMLLQTFFQFVPFTLFLVVV